MILKILECSNPETWRFFGDIKSITKSHYGTDPKTLESPAKMISNMIVRSDAYDFTNNPYSGEQNGFLEIWIYGKEKDDIKQILCFRPAYLINDEGKTIERF